MNPKEDKWLEEFREFVNAEPHDVPQEVSNKVFSYIHKALHPPIYLVFAKLLGLHAIVGTLSLAICNQFGMNPFNTTFSLSDYFMKYGHSACMVFCGVLFVGLSVFLSAYIVRPEEFRVLRKSVIIQSLGLGVLSLVTFLLLGAETTIGIMLLWLAGAFVGGISSAEITYRLRFSH